MFRPSAAFLVIGLCLCTHQALAQTTTSNVLPGVSADAVKPACPSGVPGVISVTGNGLASATSDVGTVNLRLSVQRPSADEARQLASKLTDALVTSVSRVPGIAPQNITSNAVTVSSVTQYNSSASTSVIVGYTFANTLAVRIGDLTTDKLSQVLDTSVANGGNNLTITSVDFSLSPGLQRAKNIEAQQAASDDANSTAQQFARGMKVKLGPVLSITDQSASLSTYSSTTTGSSAGTVSASSVAGAPSAAGSSSNSSSPGSIGSQRVQARILVVYTVCNPTS